MRIACERKDYKQAVIATGKILDGDADHNPGVRGVIVPTGGVDTFDHSGCGRVHFCATCRPGLLAGVPG
jgi:hypothetical protein